MALNATCFVNATVCMGTSCLVPESSFNVILGTVMSTVLTTMLAMVMFAMGCTVEVQKLWSHIRNPWGIVIGFLCQFGIMPFTGFALSLAFQVETLQAVVILIMGCCPGGTSSNIITYWLDGDMDLSISMTTCSSILALGMMPLCLLIYTTTWISAESIQIPYTSIGITLVSLLIPVSVGVFVNHQWPKIAKKILKFGSILGIVLIIVVAVVGGSLYQSSWVISPTLWIIGAIYPLVGYTLGFWLARFVGQPWYRCRTIALETGMQNAQLCSTIVQLSFSQQELEVMFSFPLIYSIFQLAVAFLAAGAYILYKKKCRKNSTEDNEDAEDAADNSYKDKHEYALENGSFQPDENSNTDDKAKTTHL